MPREKENRVIIDTNLFISFLIGKKLNILKEQIINLKVRLLFSELTIKEIGLVTKKQNYRSISIPLMLLTLSILSD